MWQLHIEIPAPPLIEEAAPFRNMYMSRIDTNLGHGSRGD
jgi:hypothetical protein